MVLFSMALALERLEHYQRPVPDKQQVAMAIALKDALGSSQDQEQGKLQTFLFALFSQKDPSQFNFTVYRFLILQSFCPKGQLARPSVITQHISKIVFFGRGAIFNEITSEMTRQECGYHT